MHKVKRRAPRQAGQLPSLLPPCGRSPAGAGLGDRGDYAIFSIHMQTVHLEEVHNSVRLIMTRCLLLCA